MAGKSSRFFNNGYDMPKYMLPLKNSNVFRESVNSFRKYFKTDFFLFITRSDFDVQDFVKKECKILGIKNFEVKALNEDTRGQADTIKIGLDNAKYNNNEEIYIFNIDSVRVDFTKPSNSFLKNTDGYLEVFEGEGEHWSFVDPLDNTYVKSTTEKLRISNLCSNGLYYFDSIFIFNKYFNQMCDNNNNYKELFVAPLYNYLIKDNRIVKYLKIPINKTVFSGTPQEYELLKLTYRSDDN